MKSRNKSRIDLPEIYIVRNMLSGSFVVSSRRQKVKELYICMSHAMTWTWTINSKVSQNSAHRPILMRELHAIGLNSLRCKPQRAKSRVKGEIYKLPRRNPLLANCDNNSLVVPSFARTCFVRRRREFS